MTPEKYLDYLYEKGDFNLEIDHVIEYGRLVAEEIIKELKEKLWEWSINDDDYESNYLQIIQDLEKKYLRDD